MANDLISKESIRKKITKLVCQKGGNVTLKDVLYEIENEPILFNTDNVEHKIKDLDKYHDGIVNVYKTINIIRSGGV